jgi:hypothetical protein
VSIRAALLAVPAAVLVALVVAGCSSSAGDDRAERRAHARSGPTTATTTTAPPTGTTSTLAPVPSTVPPPPRFDASVAEIDDAVAARMAHSWRPGCPVGLGQLRLLTLDHWGYDGTEHQGELVVHAAYADSMVEVFRRLFDARFPIERMVLVDVYGGDDHASTLANNTAAFNCRAVGNPSSWSEHAFGRAIDVNPLVNPYVLDPRVHIPELAPYLDRGREARGMIRPGDVAVEAFASVGWRWGGTWSAPDYQHFSATGR